MSSVDTYPLEHSSNQMNSFNQKNSGLASVGDQRYYGNNTQMEEMTRDSYNNSIVNKLPPKLMRNPSPPMLRSLSPLA